MLNMQRSLPAAWAMGHGPWAMGHGPCVWPGRSDRWTGPLPLKLKAQIELAHTQFVHLPLFITLHVLGHRFGVLVGQ